MSKTNRFTGELPSVHPFLGYEVPLEKYVVYRRLFFGIKIELIPVISPTVIMVVHGD